MLPNGNQTQNFGSLIKVSDGISRRLQLKTPKTKKNTRPKPLENLTVSSCLRPIDIFEI
jgi:hypothetical protein